jgi:hypothetical protein
MKSEVCTASKLWVYPSFQLSSRVLSGNNPLMSFTFKHVKMLNSASKCLKITLTGKVIKFSKPEEKNSKKTQVDGGGAC